MRNLSNPSGGDVVVGVVSPQEGGTGQITAPDAVGVMGAIASNEIGIAGGVAALDSNGRMLTRNIPAEAFSLISIEGPLSVMKGITSTYVIRNYDVFTEYTLQATVGEVSRVDDVITYTAPLTLGNAGFSINGRALSIEVVDYKPLTPLVTSPVTTSTILLTGYNITSSAYVILDGEATHQSSDWQLSTSSDFSNIVRNATDDVVNKTSWAVSGLTDGVTYYARVRYKSSTGSYSDWATAISFSVAIPVPVKPSFISHVNNGSVYQATAQLVTSAFSIQGSVATHDSTDWQLSLVPNFATLVSSSLDDTVNKTTWNISGLLDNTAYYFRARHKASNGKISDWSDTIRVNVVFAFVYNHVISASVTNFNMKAAAIAAGWNQTVPLNMSVTVNAGALVGSTSSAAYAFDTDTGYPVGSGLSLINNGKILGKGGNGGRGRGAGGLNGEVGGVGGPALRAQAPLTITNTNGTIAGGGGGGGGGGIGPEGLGNYGGGGGGGGAGFNPGASALGGTADPGGNIGAPSSAGTTSAGGAGGPSTGGSGAGGVGGALGANGGIGNNGTDPGYHNNSGVGLAAGAAGAAVIGNVNITWVNNGTRLGTIA